jgi:hypothetical protein
VKAVEIKAFSNKLYFFYKGRLDFLGILILNLEEEAEEVDK